METSVHHILIVDDVLKNLQITAQIVKEAGYLFSLSQNGQGAFSILENEVPDLILLDVMMPEMDGFEVCRKIKQNLKWKDIPIIFLTAKDQTEDLVEGFNAGGVDYISKPFNRDELLMRIKNHLELSESRKKILNMSRTRDKLYSIIAHDIRSPLSAIALTISAIAKGKLNTSGEEFKEIISHLDNSTRNTNNLLNNLLEWAKIQRGAINLYPKNTLLYPILTECLQLLDGNVKDKNITVDVCIPEETEAFFDEVTMHTVFRNIISNAIKFTPENGKIFIESKKSANFVSIIIKDTGIGMPQEVLHKIFDKNEHYTSLGTKKERGSGLGLYLVKDFMEQNNGKIEVTSAEGNGTSFSVFIPEVV